MLALPLGAQFSVTECPVPLTPAPSTVIVLGEALALLEIVTFPVTLPATFGANVTFNSAVCPAAMVAPATPLPTLKPLPLTLIVETVRLEFPVFFTATCRVLVPPTTSFPKFSVDEESEMALTVLTPAPSNAIVSVEFAAVLLSVRLPVLLPDVVGANAIVKLFVCPAASVNAGEVASSCTLNPVPLNESLEIVSATAPVFFSCTVCVFLLPIATDPKLTLLGVATNSPACTPV